MVDLPRINPNRSATVTGYIYMHTSPSGKSYIGQTIRTPEERWNEHVRHADNHIDQCRALENAIRDYGAESFIHEVLMVVNENQLDYYEATLIKAYDTKAPKGYNLRDGGDGGCTDEMRARMRIGNDKKIEHKEWKYEHHPKVKYLIWYHEINKHGTYLEGYRVSDHPNGINKTYASSKISIDERYRLAVEYKVFLDNHVGYFDDRAKRPMHVGRYKESGYKVRMPGFPSKWFWSGDERADEIAAYEYLISICPNNKFDRVFKNCVIPI